MRPLSTVPLSLLLTLTSILLPTPISAQRILETLSFGHKARLAPEGSTTIPNWHSTSSNHEIQILSNKAILTPPYPGNTRGALWAQHAVEGNHWIAEVEFRASGEEVGNGNFQFWYVKDKSSVAIDSVYTAGIFDGLVVVVDQYGGTAGKIRGFLNDGTESFREEANLESLSFGQCDYAYRNRGKPSKLRVQSENGLAVLIDDKICFSTDKVSLPGGYFYGLSATTGEQHPDSFEINSFLAIEGKIERTREEPGAWKAVVGQTQQTQTPQSGNAETSPNHHKLSHFPNAPASIPDVSPSEIKSQTEQFADLHNRLQTLSHGINIIFEELEILDENLEAKMDHITALIPTTSGSSSGGNTNAGLDTQLKTLDTRLSKIEYAIDLSRRTSEKIDHLTDVSNQLASNLDRVVDSIQRGSLAGAKGTEAGLKGIVDSMEAMRPRGIGLGVAVALILGCQVALAVGFVVYQRRREGGPKKYL